MHCRQCKSWRPTGELTPEQAIDHLVEVHPGRAAIFIKKLKSFAEGCGEIMDHEIMRELDEALGHRSEFVNEYGVYE